ncbi:Putative ribonuclease H protein At1g65750 [Linum perenne]
MITDNNTTPSDSIWSHIWRWSGPNRIKHFLWLASHKKLLMNEERGRRQLTTQVLCHRCSSFNESISHVFYECNFAMQVWRAALPEAITVRNACRDFDSWWRVMISNKDSNTQFGIIAWLLWRARNQLIFEERSLSVLEISEQCKFWIDLVLSSWKTSQLGREAPGKARQTQLIAWRPGEEGWSILNTDGSRHLHSESTAIGGLIRNWDIRIEHVYREANCGADYLANFGHSCNFGLHLFSQPDSTLAQWLRYDLVGGALPRAVLI